MISLAQRVRDFRYAKGWGPDELASRAEISRTALYQIESGKTGLPRAGTLRRIAVALDVSMDELLGHMETARQAQVRPLADHANLNARPRDLGEWVPSEGGPLATSSLAGYSGYSSVLMREDHRTDDPRVPADPAPRHRHGALPEVINSREGELMTKFQDVLHSPLGPGIARIVDELHQMLPRSRSLG